MSEPGGRQRGENRSRPAGQAVDGTRPEPPTGRPREILAMLRESGPPLSIAQLADRLDAHPDTMRFHLDALVGAGQVERVQAAPAGPGGPPLPARTRLAMNAAGRAATASWPEFWRAASPPVLTP